MQTLDSWISDFLAVASMANKKPSSVQAKARLQDKRMMVWFDLAQVRASAKSQGHSLLTSQWGGKAI